MSAAAMLVRALLAAAACIAAGSWSAAARGDELGGREIVERVETLLWGKTMQGELEMSVITPRWTRTLALRVWMDRPRRSFVRIIAPAKEAGIGSLRLGSDMWNYLPNVERTIKVPPSMMLQPWMGSDFSNDDLVKSSSFVDDYTHRVIGIENIDGVPAYLIEALPKPEAAVVWGRVVFRVRKADLIPLQEEFYSDRGELVRVMTFADVRPMGGRVMPTRWEMRPLAKSGNSTVVVVRSAIFDRPLESEVFTQRNLQKP